MTLLLNKTDFRFERDDLGMLEQPVQYRSGGRDISNEFSPVFNRTVAGVFEDIPVTGLPIVSVCGGILY